MSKRLSDRLRELAKRQDQRSEFGLGYSEALNAVARDLDGPEFSGKIIYEQRNAAQEAANRWETEAKRWKRGYEALARTVVECEGSDMQDVVDDVGDRYGLIERDDASQEDG